MGHCGILSEANIQPVFGGFFAVFGGFFAVFGGFLLAFFLYSFIMWCRVREITY